MESSLVQYTENLVTDYIKSFCIYAMWTEHDLLVTLWLELVLSIYHYLKFEHNYF